MLKNEFRRYLAVFLLASVVFFLVPVPYKYIQSIRQYGMVHQFMARSDTVMFGASTIDGASPCDSDKRSIADMFADKTRKPVIDGSYVGQSMEESVNYAALMAKLSKINKVIITSAWIDLMEPGSLSLHDYISLRELNPQLDPGGPLTYFQSPSSLISPTPLAYLPFTYKGVAYPGLDAFQNILFTQERAARTCPENDGHNFQYIYAVYYHRMIEREPAPSNAKLIISLNKYLQSRQKSMVFLLMPVNFDKLGQIDEGWPALVRQRRDAFLAQLRAGDVPVLDLSEGLPNQLFKDRWCGCTHYIQSGRMFVADKLAQFFAETAVVAGKT